MLLRSRRSKKGKGKEWGGKRHGALEDTPVLLTTVLPTTVLLTTVLLQQSCGIVVWTPKPDQIHRAHRVSGCALTLPLSPCALEWKAQGNAEKPEKLWFLLSVYHWFQSRQWGHSTHSWTPPLVKAGGRAPVSRLREKSLHAHGK